ncbi:hypothetical protein [Brevibacillus sp. SYSU BS000544]
MSQEVMNGLFVVGFASGFTVWFLTSISDVIISRMKGKKKPASS